jgi:hypothetical protein
MHRRRWLVVGLCFCVFSGCKACQSIYDYCGPMPDQGGDFMYRKNSVLGGDPAMKRIDDEPAAGKLGDEEESGPEPTPAPPADEEPRPGMEMDDESPELSFDTEIDEQADDELDADAWEDDEVGDELADSDIESTAPPPAALQWHAASSKRNDSSIRQVRFRDE